MTDDLWKWDVEIGELSIEIQPRDTALLFFASSSTPRSQDCERVERETFEYDLTMAVQRIHCRVDFQFWMPEPSGDAGVTNEEAVDLLKKTARLPKIPAQFLGDVLRFVVRVAWAFVVQSLWIPVKVTPPLCLHVVDIVVS